jgi:hypothetical protein
MEFENNIWINCNFIHSVKTQREPDSDTWCIIAMVLLNSTDSVEAGTQLFLKRTFKNEKSAVKFLDSVMREINIDL